MTQMTEVNVADATGAALDWLTGSTEGLNLAVDRGEYGTGPRVFLILEHGIFRYRPSTEWVQCGPLIEKHRLDISAPPLIDTNNEIGWQARPDDGMSFWKQGSTPLIAACRAIVTAKLGNKVMVPAELAGGDL